MMELGQKEVSAVVGCKGLITRSRNERKNLQQFQAKSPVQGSLDIRSPRREHRKSTGVKVIMDRQ